MTRRIARLRRPLAVVALLAAAQGVQAQDKNSAPGTVFRDCPACPEMVVIPAGQFVMGSSLEESGHPDEKPQHSVTLARPFAIGKTEVAFEQWDACVADGKCPAADDEGFGRQGIPAINVSWNDAKAYAGWLAAKTGRKYRLVTEAEWEYAARAGTTTAWFWGAAEDSAGSTKACQYANTHDETSKEAHPMYVWSNHKCADGIPEVGPVGKFEPNAFGLHDMLGNLREWVEDCHRPGYKDAPTDGSAWNDAACEKRILRGGGWVDGASTTRAAYRYPEDPKYRNYQVGFRVARDL